MPLLTLGGYAVATEDGIDISMAVLGREDFTGFGIERAICRRLYEPKGDARGCRCDWICFSPHAHGTHIESVAHVSEGAESTLCALRTLPPLLLAMLIDCRGDNTNDGGDGLGDCGSGRAVSLPTDLTTDDGVEALVVHTGWLQSVTSSPQGRSASPYLSDQSMVRLGLLYPNLRVLLIDSLSVDPQQDGGKLLAHRAFFGGGARDGGRPSRLIVELCRIPDDAPAGRCAVALNAAAVNSDAVPCRPVLYKVTKNTKVLAAGD